MIKHILFAVLIVAGVSIFDVVSFGAIANSDTVHDQFINSNAILEAVKAANVSEGERIVRIPGKKFYSMPVYIENVHNVTISIVGKLIASKNAKHWPKKSDNKTYYNFLTFESCSYIEIEGGGKIDGRGYHWWMLVLLQPNKYLTNQNQRPHLIQMIDCDFIRMHDLILKNPGQWTVKLDHCHDGEIFNIDIKVNTTAQINLIKKFSLEGSVIMFPFNTDGIDPSGARFHIYNITCQNYDDVVVPKPSRQVDCTRDMLIENCTVVLGVGMSIGSVPPNTGCACVRNITFRNVKMTRPLKGIYVKSNPGNSGTGLIENILYQNFTMDRPIWWAVYIGPQQMKEPDGDGPGCMLYPFDKKGTCGTQPRVTMRNITLENVQIHNSILYPYTVRCNASNPCTEINFYNVRTDKWMIGQKENGYVCEYAMGKRSNNYPPMHCLNEVGVAQQKEEQSVAKRTVFDDMFERTLTGFKVSRLLFEELERATAEVGYVEEDDDFAYDLVGTGMQDLELSVTI